MYLGIYDHEFVNGMYYSGLALDFPAQVARRYFWRTITQATGQDSRKASLLINPAHRYIHALMSISLMGWADSTGVMLCMDLLIMYYMIHHHSLNLGHVVAKCIARYNQNPPIELILTGPYITHLAKGMNAKGHDCIMEWDGGTISLELQTPCAIGIMEHQGSTYMLANLSRAGTSSHPISDHDEDAHAPPPP